MSYDALGRRVTKQTQSQTRQSLYDFQHLLRESDGSGDLLKEYTFTPNLGYGDLLSQYDGNATLYHEYDALGSTQGLLSDAAAEVDRWVYRAYGLPTQTLGSDSNVLTFVGRQSYYSDTETALYLLGSVTMTP